MTELNIMEMECLEYLLARIIYTYETEYLKLDDSQKTNVRELVQYHPNQVLIAHESSRGYTLFDNLIEEIFLQDNRIYLRYLRYQPNGDIDCFPHLLDITWLIGSYRIDLAELQDRFSSGF